MSGKKGGNKVRKGAKKYQQPARAARLIEPTANNQFYGQVRKFCGGSIALVACTDGTNIEMRMPRRWQRKRQWVHIGDIVIVQKDSAESPKGDGVYVYKPDETNSLRAQGLLDTIVASKQNDGDDAIQFDQNSQNQSAQHSRVKHSDDMPDILSDGDDADDELQNILTKCSKDALGNYIDDDGDIIDCDALLEKIVRRNRRAGNVQHSPKQNNANESDKSGESDEDVSFGSDEGGKSDDEGDESDGSFDIDDI
jgi:initiation factor 1A